MSPRKTAAQALIEQAQQSLARAYGLVINDDGQSPGTWLAEAIDKAHSACNGPLSLLDTERLDVNLQAAKAAWHNR